jgi:hypothetical protein
MWRNGNIDAEIIPVELGRFHALEGRNKRRAYLIEVMRPFHYLLRPELPSMHLRIGFDVFLLSLVSC